MKNLKKSNEKSLASTGIALLYPVSVMGQHFRENGMPHHMTVKFFDKPETNIDDAHDFSSEQHLPVPNPHKITVSPKVFKNRFGEDVHVLSLEGEGLEHVKEANAKGAHLGLPVNYKFTPHISVDKKTHDFVAQSKEPVKASDLGIEFGPAELRHGHRVVASYGPIHKDMMHGLKGQEDEGLAKSSLYHRAAGAAAMLGLLGSPQITQKEQEKVPTQESQKSTKSKDFNQNKILRAIASVESNSGKNLKHAPLGGIHAGESAYGTYGLTPLLIREVVNDHEDLKNNYGKAVSLKGNEFHEFMKKNPELEHEVAKRHLARLHKYFGGDPEKIGYAWLNGIAGTSRAIKKGVDIENHWHVKKIKKALQDIGNTKKIL